MKKREIKKLISLCMAAMVFTGSFFSASEDVYAKDWYSKDEYHANIDFEDLKYVGIDMDYFNRLIRKLSVDASMPKNAYAVINDYDELYKAFDAAETQFTLAQLAYDKNCLDEELTDEYNKCFEDINDMQDKFYAALRDALQSDYKDYISTKIGDDDLVDGILNYEELTDEQRQLMKREKELEQQYDTYALEEYYCKLADKSYTIEEAANSYLAGELTYDQYYDLYEQYVVGRNNREASVYPELVQVRNQLAKLDGYDNYVDYAYESVYGRDYTPEQAKTLHRIVKRNIVPLYTRLYYEYDWKSNLNYNPDAQEVIELIGQYLDDIDPELMEAYDYMVDHHLYDIDESETKRNVGYTTSMASIGAPFIFNAPEENWYRVETTIHEFGHYNEEFHNIQHVLDDETNYDVAEVFSQGLEVLFLDYADEMYGEENADEVRLAVLYGLLTAIISGCIYDEFQVEAYNYDGELDVPTLNKMYRKIALEYDYIEPEDPINWTYIAHTFDSPFYYISYSTSALAALEIFGQSLVDRQSAIDHYMELTTYGSDIGFSEALEKAGVGDVFDFRVVGDTADTIEDYMEEMIDRHPAMNEPSFVKIHLVIFGTILIILLLMVISLIIKKRRNSKDNLDF